MSLEVVYGASRDRTLAVNLSEALKSVVASGTIYLGYPVLASADDQVDIDALLVSGERGLVAFLIARSQPASIEEWRGFIDAQDRLFAVLESTLRRHERLRVGRQLAVTIRTATVFASPVEMPRELGTPEGFFGDLAQTAGWIETLGPLEEEVLRSLNAALQRVTTIKPAKRRTSVQQVASRGATIKKIERNIANLDEWQKAAAIDTPEGPQRIRGLAGSGKTVVLALKAAYLHASFPEWNIAVTFSSRALYKQIEDLVTRFSFEHLNDKPDPDRLRILPTWGSHSSPGMYSMMATALGMTPRDYGYARGMFGIDNAFQGICQELLEVAKQVKVEPIFDAVLIDEAQDLPPEFFQLVYLFTKEPKRIVWGFDELQKLSEAVMPNTDEMFGLDASGAARVSLAERPNEPRKDILLPVCYRNTPWALATAHSLGLGIYRQDGGLLQHPDDPSLWEQIGYEVVQGRLELGQQVSLRRSSSSYPRYFDELLQPDDAVVLKSFADEVEQDTWVAEQIKINLTQDELEFDDILIVLPDTYRAKSRAPRLISTLRRYGIPAHLVGVNSSVDEVFVSGSVALAHIHRAKGNEAPMVYVIDAHYAAHNFNAVTRRNTLFTAITRSRAWVRIVGWGEYMQAIAHEVAEVRSKSFRLDFKIPTPPELAQLRHIYRDRSAVDEASVRKATDGLKAFLDVLERDEIEITDLPAPLRNRLRALGEGLADGDD